MTIPWVSIDEVAKRLGMREDAINRGVERWALPAHKVGRLWELKLYEVDA